MARRRTLDLSHLPQVDEEWHVISRSAPAWVDGDAGDPYRPHMLVAFEASSGVDMLLLDSIRIKHGQAVECLDITRPPDSGETAAGGVVALRPDAISRQYVDKDSGLLCTLRIDRQLLLLPLIDADPDYPRLPLRDEIDAYQFLHYSNRADTFDNRAYPHLALDDLLGSMPPELIDALAARFGEPPPRAAPPPTSKAKRKK